MARKDPNSFTKKTRDVLAKRAGQTCSNPFCKKPTTGPHTEHEKNVDVGEAAHIRGARPLAKRYDPDMEPEERCNIFNGIWLCRKCAKLIDSDERKFTVELLYDWKRKHEREITRNLLGDNWQVKLDYRQLKPFESESAAAYQIALDQGENWKYFLTVELLRSKTGKIKNTYEDLHRGLVYRQSKALRDKEDLRIWLKEKINDFTALLRFFNVVLGEDLNESWGDSGDALAILRTINLIEEGCRGLLDWEIDLNYTMFPSGFEEIQVLMKGWTIQGLQEIEKIHKDIANTLNSSPKPQGTQRLSLRFEPPENIDQVGILFEQLWHQNL